MMANLKQARNAGKLDQFAQDHDADPPGDEALFNALWRQWPERRKHFRMHRLRTIANIEAVLDAIVSALLDATVQRFIDLDMRPGLPIVLSPSTSAMCWRI